MIKNQKGYTLIEILIAAAIGSISVYALSSFLVGLNKMNAELRLKRVTGNTIQSLAESIRFNTSLFQVTFDNSGAAEQKLLAPASLPLGITTDGTMVQRSDCSLYGCRAYAGYVIIPHEFIRNLYQVRFLVVNSSNVSEKWESSYYITVK